MQCRFSDFRDKEVICIRTGARLGYPCDMEFQSPEGRVIALIVPGKPRWFGLFGRGEDYIIPWECITRVGEDVILIESDRGVRRGKQTKKPWFT